MLTACLRTTILFFVTAIVLRLMGKRQLAQLQPYEVVITLMISDLATLPMGDVEIPLMGGVVAIVTLLVLHSLLSVLSFASMRMRSLICGRPSVLVRNGRICEKELSRLCFDLSDLMEGIRSSGIIGLHETGCVVLETNGTLSVFPRAASRPLSPQDMNLTPAEESLPVVLIADGSVRQQAVSEAGIDPEQLRRQLNTWGFQDESQVLLCCFDGPDQFFVQGYDDRKSAIRAKLKDTCISRQGVPS